MKMLLVLLFIVVSREFSWNFACVLLYIVVTAYCYLILSPVVQSFFENWMKCLTLLTKMH
jgi:hypothetical protein